MTQSPALAFWDHCLLHLQSKLPENAFRTWVKPIIATVSEEGSLVLTTPNRHIRDFFASRYLNLVDQLAFETFPDLKISLDIKKAEESLVTRKPPLKRPTANKKAFSTENMASLLEKQKDHVEKKETLFPENKSLEKSGLKNSKKQRSSRHGLNSHLTFDNLVIGKANELAFSAATQILEHPGKIYNPLLIYGSTSLGKTHLIQAIGNKINELNPDFNIRYIDSETLYREYFNAMQQNTIDSYKHYFQTLDFFIIDDIQFLSKKFGTQNELFHTFNALLAKEKQIIVTSDKYPTDIKELEPRIVSRFGGGLTVMLEPPELEMRVSILHKKASSPEINLTLTEEAAFFMAKHIRSNVRELEGALNRVLAFVTFGKLTGTAHKVIGIDVIREALSDILHKQNAFITIESIQKTVADYYRIKVSDLYSKTRQQKIARPRQISMALARDLTQYSLPQIGESFGGRDHTTVIHACKTIEKLRSLDETLNHDYHLLRQILKGGDD